jgi:hypothetical protein
MKYALLLLTAATFSLSAFAQDAKVTEPKTAVKAEETNRSEKATDADTKKVEDRSSTYAPDFCDFEITFPEAPLKAMKCLADNNQCYELNSYTMVYDLQTTVDVSVTCNPSTPAAYERYNESVIKAALAGMVSDRNLDNHTVNFSQEKDYRNAALLGTGKTGRQDKIYSAQMWIGKNSVFTVQAELIGSAHPDADKTFGDVLKSIQVKGGQQLPAPAKAKSN